MSKITNYDSTRTLDNYQIGRAYTFLIHNPNKNQLIKINEAQFEKQIESLTNIIDFNKEFENNSQHFNFTRSIGLVIDKHQSTNYNDIDYITVIFKNDNNEFVLNKYITNSNSHSTQILTTAI